jgi:hypothetical protein
MWDVSPDEPRAQLFGMNNRTSDVRMDNKLWWTRYEALERQQKFDGVKAQLIARTCDQLVAKVMSHAPYVMSTHLPFKQCHRTKRPFICSN